MIVGKMANYVEFKKQKYAQIQKQHLKVGVLFCDPLFPPDTASIGNFSEIPEPVEWKRPKELCESPRLIDGELSPESVIAGPISCNWFVTACTILAGISELCHKVVPEYWKQEWNAEEGEYTGLFHFHFWRFGQWMDVIVDDLLPTSENKIISTHSSKPSEFWISLLEKAYAKLHGSYEALSGGRLPDALVDFTGGVSEVLDLSSGDYSGSSDEQAGLYSFLEREVAHHCIVCAVVNGTTCEEESSVTPIGLHVGGTYLVTGIKKISLGDTGLKKLFKTQVKQPMVRVRDLQRISSSSPHETSINEQDIEGDGMSSGRGSTANSPKSEKAPTRGLYSQSKLSRLLSSNPEWARVRDSDLNKIGLTCENSSEFWLPLEDFVSNFCQLTICHLFNTNLFAVNKKWRECSVRGQWSTGVKGTQSDRAGGCNSFSETFLRNPQYMFDVKPFEEEVVIQMLQWDPTGTSLAAGEERLLITFYIIRVEENRKYRLHKLWEHTPTVVQFSPTRKRELFYRGSLTKGRYIIIPAAHKPGDIGGYFLRMFSDSYINLRNIKHDVPSKACTCCPGSYPIWATVIVIKRAENLQKFQSSCDSYCVIKCEGKTARTQIVKNTTEPAWDVPFIFYRKKTAEPIVIRVYGHKMMTMNSFLGQVQLPAPVNQGPTPLEAELQAKGGKETTTAQGSLYLEVFTNDNLWEV